MKDSYKGYQMEGKTLRTGKENIDTRGGYKRKTLNTRRKLHILPTSK